MINFRSSKVKAGGMSFRIPSALVAKRIISQRRAASRSVPQFSSLPLVMAWFPLLRKLTLSWLFWLCMLLNLLLLHRLLFLADPLASIMMLCDSELPILASKRLGTRLKLLREKRPLKTMKRRLPALDRDSLHRKLRDAKKNDLAFS